MLYKHTVIVFAQRLLDKGLVIQAHHIVRQHRLAIGSFSLRDVHDAEMKRATRTAVLQMADTFIARHQTPREIGTELFPRLLDATLVHWHDRVFTLSGFERVDDGARECSYRQSWLVRIPTAEEMDVIQNGAPGAVSGHLETQGA